jgi:hypothetical protein
MTDLVVVVNGTDPMAVMRRGLDGGGAQQGQHDGSGDQLVHGDSPLKMGITQTPSP